MNANANRKILIINAVECEPGLLHDDWLIQNKAEAIRMGIHYLNQAFGFERILFATKEQKQEVFRCKGVEVLRVPARYPMGEEHFLIRQLLNIQLEKREIPAAHGILVLNVQTVYQISQIVNGAHIDGRYITVADLTTGEARITYVTPKENIVELLKHTYSKEGMYYAGQGILAAHTTTKQEQFTPDICFAAVGHVATIGNENPVFIAKLVPIIVMQQKMLQKS